jgi:hypothetical protein
MSTPQRPPGKTPPRAEPIQPDRPGRGLGSEPPDEERHTPGKGAGPGADSGSDRAAEQEEAARTNVREGYE